MTSTRGDCERLMRMLRDFSARQRRGKTGRCLRYILEQLCVEQSRRRRKPLEQVLFLFCPILCESRNKVVLTSRNYVSKDNILVSDVGWHCSARRERHIGNLECECPSLEEGGTDAASLRLVRGTSVRGRRRAPGWGRVGTLARRWQRLPRLPWVEPPVLELNADLRRSCQWLEKTGPKDTLITARQGTKHGVNQCKGATDKCRLCAGASETIQHLVEAG
ncbi:uncharacterized protein LOC118241998 [Electrophorus electricus]|uniref:uncharacterized protein LOC118241998 n=1 Tax=Electrophorus electricus TaxID=8005 RepID=UPI0015CF8C3D|nr:uncharacterized protein LOC118241998 [Electrophorus electricus]